MYRIYAVRDNETVKWERSSELIALAKARVWASEGWEVTITDDQGNELASLGSARMTNANIEVRDLWSTAAPRREEEY